MSDTKSNDNPQDKAELERKLKDRGDTKGAPVTKPGGAAVTK